MSSSSSDWEAWRAWSRGAPENVLRDFLTQSQPQLEQRGEDDELYSAITIVLDELAKRINHYRRI